ncbi:hypothetical protein POKO110462_00655 [Pontibacter korlensis]|uniref:Phosphoribosylpyrophosphate synthetase n=1 Tax=Pontibacter korlensis TaxID=400092 RepID=A0A0E3ZCT5_9BACT|nr:hypothetical protein [Pontibacter korlensis]AKD02784.1 hypothetical protein PKOR_06165 [Pontibacter korlensis]
MEDKVELTSLVGALNKLHKDGYKVDFKVTEEGRLSTMDDKQTFGPDQVRIVDFYRFEGESNPDDMAILYVLETSSGLKGTISDSYGPYANETIENFMKQVEDLGMDLDKGNR